VVGLGVKGWIESVIDLFYNFDSLDQWSNCIYMELPIRFYDHHPWLIFCMTRRFWSWSCLLWLMVGPYQDLVKVNFLICFMSIDQFFPVCALLVNSDFGTLTSRCCARDVQPFRKANNPTAIKKFVLVWLSLCLI